MLPFSAIPHAAFSLGERQLYIDGALWDPYTEPFQIFIYDPFDLLIFNMTLDLKQRLMILGNRFEVS